MFNHNNCPYYETTLQINLVHCKLLAQKTGFSVFRERKLCDICYRLGEYKKTIEDSPINSFSYKQFLFVRLLQGELPGVHRFHPIDLISTFKKYQAVSSSDEQRDLLLAMLSYQCQQVEKTGKFTQEEVVEKIIELINVCGLEEIAEQITEMAHG